MKKDILTKVITYIIVFFIGIFLLPIKNYITEQFFQPKSCLSVKSGIAKIIDKESLYIDSKNNSSTELKKNLETINKFYVYNITIQNTGTQELNYQEFYTNETLKIDAGKCGVLGAYIDNGTKNYINAQIEKVENNNVYIKFDTLEPKDSIYIKILRSDSNYKMKIYGKTKTFDIIKPLDYDTTKIIYTDDIPLKLKPKSFIDYAFIIFLVIITITTIVLFFTTFLNIQSHDTSIDTEEGSDV